MTSSKIHTYALVELYGMAKMYAENNPLTDRQTEAIELAETIIENKTGYEITKPFKND